jgi:hypothetical protein
MFENADEQKDMMKLFDAWSHDPQNMKTAFLELKDKFQGSGDVTFSFKSRPGVSFSFRVKARKSRQNNRPLFALMDIVDDQSESRWLSICFYSDLVTDPEGEGNLVPEGILGEDGYCFDLFEYDRGLITYIEQRVDEAYANVQAGQE